MTGYVRAVLVHPGDIVSSGQLLAELEANDSRASVARSRAALAEAGQRSLEAQSALDAAHSAASVAQATHERLQQLLTERAISQQKYEDQEASWRNAAAQEQMARAHLRAVAAGVDEARAGLAESQAALDYSRIVAPFAGRVLERRIDPGALAAPGVPLFVVADEGLLRVEAALEESRGLAVKIGDVATVETNALPTPVIGSVSEIIPSVDVASRAFVAKIDLPVGTTLRSGTFARVEFDIGTRSALVVPSNSVTAMDALERVFVVQGDTARLRMVTLGAALPPWTEVLSGLSADENVVTEPPSQLRDGSRVAVAR
jgi:multidrug efflux pump subunit AcrA (membrane-fusion protein)